MGVFKTCPITKQKHNTPGKRCRLCENKRLREFLKTPAGRIYSKKKNALQSKTTAKAAYRIIAGAIRYKGFPKASKFMCVDCGKKAEVYDHRDYLKPLDVEPVCKKCNFKRGPGKNNRTRRRIRVNNEN